jgi:hypothetical protein
MALVVNMALGLSYVIGIPLGYGLYGHVAKK